MSQAAAGMFHFEVHNHFQGLGEEHRILAKLNSIEGKVDQIMTDLEQLKTALDTINSATNEQGTVLAAEAASLQTISDNLDKLISNPGIPAEIRNQAQALADNAAAVAVNLKKNADFATAIASKGAGNPVPLPVPSPTPLP